MNGKYEAMKKTTRHLDVVLLDEEEAFAEASANFLTRFFRKIHLASDLETVLNLVDGNEPPHAAIVEREFPFTPWNEAIREIRERKKGTVVLLMGPESLKDDRDGSDGYVRKPIEKNQLVMAVGEGVLKKVAHNGFHCGGCLFRGATDRREDCRFEGGKKALAAGQCPFA